MCDCKKPTEKNKQQKKNTPEKQKADPEALDFGSGDFRAAKPIKCKKCELTLGPELESLGPPGTPPAM